MYDIEANGLELHEVTKVWCICTHDIVSKEEYQFGQDEIQSAVDYLGTANRLICHNEFWYDLPVLRKLYGFNYCGSVIDTLVLSRLASPDRIRPIGMLGKAGPHSLEAWGYRFGDYKVQWEDWSKYDPVMLERCMSDVRINVRVYEELFKELSK